MVLLRSAAFGAALSLLSSLAPAYALSDEDRVFIAPPNSSIVMRRVTQPGPAVPPGSNNSLASRWAIYSSWMSNEVLTAWQAGYQGQGTRVFVVDDYTSATRLTGNLGQGLISQQHGWWTSSQVKAIAPLATVDTISWANAAPLPIASTPGLKIVNMSYAVYAAPSSSITWDPLQSSIIKAANAGQIVAVKAAGNDGIAVNATNVSGLKDFMNAALFNAPSLILAGALNANGSPTAQTTRASYSNYAGSDPAAQARFLFVGVPGDATKLYGTSFAAPVISGYASVLGSKFTSGTATQIANQLLATARTDTIKDYSASVYGRGEASLSRALAPASIH